MHHRLSQLSGGQQQRVAIAISLANDPDLLLADEPTGEVDTQTAGQIYDILRYLNRERGLTIIIVSHDRSIARQVDRVVAIRDGRTSTETVRRVSIHEEGDDHTHDEFVIVDDTGRLQVPQEMLDQLSIRGRALVDMEGDRIVIRSGTSGIATVAASRAASEQDADAPTRPGAPPPDQPIIPARVELAAPVIPARHRPTRAAPKPARPDRAPPARARPRDVPDEHRPFAPPGGGETRDG